MLIRIINFDMTIFLTSANWFIRQKKALSIIARALAPLQSDEEKPLNGWSSYKILDNSNRLRSSP
jgi:hypothetical protein